MRRLVAIALCLFLVACGGDAATGPKASPVGVYALQTINGQAGPWIGAPSGGQRTDILSVSLSLNGDRTYSLAGQVRVTTVSSTTTSTSGEIGTWRLDGDAVTLTSATGGLTTLAWSGATLTATFSEFGGVLVFQRQ